MCEEHRMFCAGCNHRSFLERIKSIEIAAELPRAVCCLAPAPRLSRHKPIHPYGCRQVNCIVGPVILTGAIEITMRSDAASIAGTVISGFMAIFFVWVVMAAAIVDLYGVYELAQKQRSALALLAFLVPPYGFLQGLSALFGWW
jgi:hypothetical protein